MDVTPVPGIPEHYRAYDGMLGFMEMLRLADRLAVDGERLAVHDERKLRLVYSPRSRLRTFCRRWPTSSQLTIFQKAFTQSPFTFSYCR